MVSFWQVDDLGYGKRKYLYAPSEKAAFEKLEVYLPEHKKGLRIEPKPTDQPSFLSDDPHVYLLQSVLGGPIKIGVAQNVVKRLATIQMYSPFVLQVVAVIEHAGYDVERRFHRMLERDRLHGEWFEETTRLWQLVDKFRLARQQAVDGHIGDNQK